MRILTTLKSLGFSCLSCAVLSAAVFCVPYAAMAEEADLGHDILGTVKTAVAYSPELSVQKAEQSINQAEVLESRSAMFPNLSVSAEAGRSSLNNDTTRGLTLDEDNAQSYTADGSVSLVQPLYAGQSLKNRYRAAKDRKISKDFELEAALSEVVRQATRAHIDVARGQMLVRETQNFITAINSYRARMELMVDEGALGIGDLLRADDLIILAENALLSYQEELELNKASYREIVGLDPMENLAVRVDLANPHLPVDVDEAISRARNLHPFIQAADMKTAAFDRDYKAEKGEILPRVDAEVSYSEGDRAEELGGETSAAQALVRMTWDFSLGGGHRARVNRAGEQKNRSIADKGRRLASVERDVRQRFAEYQLSAKQFEILKKREEANINIFKTYEQEFEAGMRSILDLVTAQNQLFESKVGRITAEYRHQLSRYDVLGAMGRVHTAFGYSVTK